MMANTWHGEFPWRNLKTDRFEETSPVGSYPPNGYGLHDMAGNVWEWTSDNFTPDHAQSCRGPSHPQVSSPELSKVIKGGSHLCAPNHCFRYRPAARQAETVDALTRHVGFRCIIRVVSS
jgi:formylglycine-generating enzyme required for sulfatase activity